MLLHWGFLQHCFLVLQPNRTQNINSNSEDTLPRYGLNRSFSFSFSQIYDAGTLSFPLPLYNNNHRLVTVWASDNQTLLSISQGGHMKMWNVPKAKQLSSTEVPFGAWVMSCAISDSMKFVACGELYHIIGIFRYNADKNSIKHIQGLFYHQSYISDIAFVNDEQVISSSGDFTVCLGCVSTGNLLHSFQGHTADVMRSEFVSVWQIVWLLFSISLNSTKTVMATGSCDSTVKLWDLRTQQCVNTIQIHDKDVNRVVYSVLHSNVTSGNNWMTVFHMMIPNWRLHVTMQHVQSWISPLPRRFTVWNIQKTLTQDLPASASLVLLIAFTAAQTQVLPLWCCRWITFGKGVCLGPPFGEAAQLTAT